MLSKNELRILQILKSNSKITNKEISRIIGINERNVRRNIEKLKKKGLVKRIGPDKEVVDGKKD